VLLIGLIMQRRGPEKWKVLAVVCVLIGAIMFAGGLLWKTKGSIPGFLTVTLVFTVGAVYARSGLLAALAVFALSSCFGARTGYWHASYFLSIKEPAMVAVFFTITGILLYQLSLRLKPEFERLTIIAARTCVFLVNFGLWIGSLWDDYINIGEFKFKIDENIFVVVWAIALIIAGVWAWSRNRRAMFNICAVFAAIHFYTQWFENLRYSPWSLFTAGVIALTFAISLKIANDSIKASG